MLREILPGLAGKSCFSPEPGPVLKLPTQYCATPPLDFRSQAFHDAAVILAQTTGCSLMLCRQELFIAEGDIVQAGAGLLARKTAMGNAVFDAELKH